MMKEWASVRELFAAVRTEKYVVLRNFENLEEEITSGPHPDIDFLCADPDKLKEALHLQPRGKVRDGIHYKAAVGGKEVAVDLRHIGDGYLDKKWEYHILKNRKVFDRMCFIPEETDHMYSLLYHALIQKRAVSDDYCEILSAFFGSAFSDGSRQERLAVLETFMKQNGYSYTYPEYPLAIFNTEGASAELIEKNPARKILHAAVSGARQVIRK